MLANGARLEIKEGSAYVDLRGLKEIPEIGVDAEKVENTTLADSVKIYELGIGDAGDLTYKFKYENTANSSYRKLRALADSKAVGEFQQTMNDGTKYQFSAQASVKVSGGAVNAVIEFTLNLALQSRINVVDPE